MPQLFTEPAVTLIKKADCWQEEEWIITPKKTSDTLHAFRASNTSGDGTKQDITKSKQYYGFVRGNRLVKDILLGLYDQSLVGGTATLHTENGVLTGWSSKSALADLLSARYATEWLPDEDDHWVIYEADGETALAVYDTLREAILAVIAELVRLLSNQRGGV